MLEKFHLNLICCTEINHENEEAKEVENSEAAPNGDADEKIHLEAGEKSH
jgi:hypothetical protein